MKGNKEKLKIKRGPADLPLVLINAESLNYFLKLLFV